MTPLTHDLVRRVVTEEAAEACTTFDAVIGMAIYGAASLARRRAMIRLVHETGCTADELARTWGCDRSLVYRFARRWGMDLARPAAKPRPAKPAYDWDTIIRFCWAHGEGTAASIVAGTDMATRQDIAAWRSLGGGRAS